MKVLKVTADANAESFKDRLGAHQAVCATESDNRRNSEGLPRTTGQGHLFVGFGIVFVITVTFAFYSLYAVDNLPNKLAEVRLRRISIAELDGQLAEDNLKGDAKDVKIPKLIEKGPAENLSPEGQAVPGRTNQDIHISDKLLNGDIKENPQAHIDTKETHIDSIQSNGLLQDQTQRSSDGGPPLQTAPITGRPRIFCMLYTTMDNWATRGRAVRDTWAQRCDVYKFFYTARDGTLPLPENEAVALPVPDGRNHLTAKTMVGLRWAYENYGGGVDWFFKADDDTFVIMENLRFVAAQFRPSESHYIGGRSTDKIKHGYNGGGAGYLLSKEAARLILQEGRMQPNRCKPDGGVEDLDIGVCLETFKVYPIDTRDKEGRLTFHPDHPYKIFAKQGDNARVYTYRLGNSIYGNGRGIRTMSPHTVSFHYVTPAFMYMYDFMLYHLVRHRDDGQPGHAAPQFKDSQDP